MTSDSIVKILNETDYRELFLSADDHLKELWANGNNKQDLRKIIENPGSSDKSKFLAAELLSKFEVPLTEKAHADLARVYAAALKDTNANLDGEYQLSGNMWGYLYEHDDPGELGARIMQFEAAAVPYLQELLNDNGPVLYEGSREATVGNEYQYRIKDFAAFYLSKITNISITFYHGREQRDAEIERFRKKLKDSEYGKK